jgi:hypothetical protein
MFSVDPYVQMIPNSFEICMTLKRNISYISIVGIIVGHVLVGVIPFGMFVVVAPLPQITKLPKILKITVSKFLG